jgi:hypothetical protein
MDRPRPEEGPLLVLTFFRGPVILDEGLRSSRGFRKDYIFRKFVIKFSTAFLAPRPLRHLIFLKAAAVVVKQFSKTAKKLYKKPAIYKWLSETFLWLRNRFPKYIYPVNKILRNRFLLFIQNFRKI